MGCIEMHIRSLRDQEVRVGGTTIPFRTGETIHTESSHKYDPDDFSAWTESFGFHREHIWTDPDQNFGVLYLSYS